MPEDHRPDDVPSSHEAAPDGRHPDPGALDPGALDLGGLARDWITLWQSELAAMAVDREAQETWHSMLALWAGAAVATVAAAPDDRAHADAGGFAGAAAASGTPPAAAAPDPRDAEIERLARHVGDLEARLAELERGVRGGHGGGRRGSGRRHG